MNMSPKWALFLTQQGLEAIHWSEVGLRDSPDSEIIFWAEQNAQVILTEDLDFSQMLASSRKPGPSIVQLRAMNNSVRVIGETVLRAIRENENALASGAILTLDTRRARLRLLPL